MGLQDQIQFILENYRQARSDYEKLPTPKKMLDLRVAQLLMKKLPKALQSSGSPKLLIVGSAGKGNMAEVPHICGFDPEITQSAQNGYYIVYLFSADGSRVYLSLNQGWNSYEKIFGVQKGALEIAKNSVIARGVINLQANFSNKQISLGGRGNLSKGYELGNICSKVYYNGHVPSDEELLNDWEVLANIYNELKIAIGSSIIDFGCSVNEESFQESIQNIKEKVGLPEGPLPRIKRADRTGTLVWRRDPLISAIALENAMHLCEFDNDHTTFISHKSGKQFVEAHHFIPMEYQLEFENSLDVPENILSLCPNCHRAFHHSQSEVKFEMINWFLDRKQSLFNKRGIFISKEKLIQYYSKK